MGSSPTSVRSHPAVDLVRPTVTVAVIGLLAWFPVVAGSRVPLLGFFDLGMHELGHLVTMPLPQPLTAAAGSLTQILVPLGLAAYFLLRRRELLSAALCVAWCGANLYDVAVYVADAPYQRLPLLGGDNVIHDWAYLLGPDVMNALSSADELALALRGLGIVAFLTATGIALWAVPRRTWEWLGR